MLRNVKIHFLLLFSAVALASCSKDMDDVINPSSSLDIKNFIWKGMNNIYLYKEEIPALADDRFKDQEELNDFLKGFSSPESLFYDALVAPHDNFSFLVDDYIKLEEQLRGISVANGMQYGLIRLSATSDQVIGYVRYILPNTSAEAQGLKRGDIFNRVDGERLNIENYSRLLEPETYTIGLAELNGNQVVELEEEVRLQKEQYTSNPVFIVKTLETSVGKVGYLMYNGFTRDFDPELNKSFAFFQSEGITELVLDLRYNSGGSVESAADLASMITGQFEGEIFSREEWNEDYQTYFEENDPDRLVNRFNRTISTGEEINSLRLRRVYVLTTLRTASASELLINGLAPYIEVIQIGENTTGKFQASTTLYDSEDFGREGANPGHTYAIQPLIYKSSNVAGFTDYIDGLPPDIEIQEDVRNLGTLGNPSEPLLQTALDAIEGNVQQLDKTEVFPYKHIGESGMESILYQKMYTTENIKPFIP